MHRYRCGLPYAIASWHSRQSRCGTYLLGVLPAGTLSTHCRYSEYSLRARIVPIARVRQRRGAAEQPEQVRRERGVPARGGQACCLQVGTPIVGIRVRVIGVRVQINGTRVQIIGLGALTADCTSDHAPSGTNRSIGTRAQRSLGGHQRAPRRAAGVAPCSSCRPSHVYNGARRTFTMLHVARLEWCTLHVGTAGRRQSAVLLPRARARAHAHAALRAPVGSGSDHAATECLAPPAPASATRLGPPRPTSAPGLALQGTTRGRRTSSGSRRTAASRRTRAGPRARRRVSMRVPRASFPARRALERPSHRPRFGAFPSIARSRKEEHRLR